MLFDICVRIYQSIRCLIAEDCYFNIALRVSVLVNVIHITTAKNDGRCGSVMRIVFIQIIYQKVDCVSLSSTTFSCVH
jgi:hypothetical protein